MSYLRYFSPIFLFVTLFVGAGIVFSLQGIENPFYQLSPLVAILPAIALGWAVVRGSVQEKISLFLNGLRHEDIITMCLIFLMAGAFSEVTKVIGSVESVVNLTLSLVSADLLLIGLFLTAAIISTAIGTSTGTIAAIAPIGVSLSMKAGFSPALAAGTVLGGAMFGDNLSLISDTTIASVSSQEASLPQKLKLNAKVAMIACFLTFPLLYLFQGEVSGVIDKGGDASFWLMSPYIILIALAVSGVNVLISLFFSLIYAGGVGLILAPDFGILTFSKGVTDGFLGMHEITILSLFVGGLSGFTQKGATQMADHLSTWIEETKKSPRVSELLIAAKVSLFDILLANNTIAILFCGNIVRQMGKRSGLPPHVRATWLDIFSCVFQGLIPYGAQILLASSIAGISPLSIVPHVYYCYILLIVSIGYILWPRRNYV